MNVRPQNEYAVFAGRACHSQHTQHGPTGAHKDLEAEVLRQLESNDKDKRK